MNDTPTRKPTLQDLMVFTATTAVGLAVARYFVMNPTSLTPKFDSQGVLFLDPGYSPRDVRWWATLTSIFLAVWSMTLLFMRLRSPRPKFRAMIWSPGFLVPTVATVSVLVFVAEQYAFINKNGWPLFVVPAISGDKDIGGYLDFFPVEYMPRLMRFLWKPAAIALLVALPAYYFRKDRDWIDSLALVIGAAWTFISFG